MRLNYKTLFKIELLHDYYADGKCNDFTLLPSSDCEELLRAQGMIIQQATGNSLTVMTREGFTPGTCFIPVNKSSIFRFYMKLKPGRFINYTNIEWNPVTGKRFYFNNRANNKRGTVLNLSKEIADYTDTVTYVPGMLAKDPVTKEVYEAFKGSSNADKHGFTSPGNYWSKLGDIEYATADGDLLNCCGTSFFFNVAGTYFSIEIFRLNKTTGAYTTPVFPDAPVQTISFDKTVEGVSVDMAGLDKGRYEIKVNGITKAVYYDPSLLSNDICGVVEIFCDLDGANDYAFATEAAPVAPETQPVFTIKPRNFTIRFANRRSLWKYIAKSANLTAINDVNADAAKRYSFTVNGMEFLSDKPIPFTEQPIKLFIPHFGIGSSDPPPLPNAAGELLKKQKINPGDSYEFYCSEIYLNY
jgi:hypothetical protein